MTGCGEGSGRYPSSEPAPASDGAGGKSNVLAAEVLALLEDRLEADRLADMVLEMRRLKVMEARLLERLNSLEGRLRATQRLLRELLPAFDTCLSLLEQQGVLDPAEIHAQVLPLLRQYGLDERYQAGLGILLAPPDAKAPATAEGPDCEARLSLCQGACCKLRFALTAEEVRAGCVAWDGDHPFQLARGEDGYCLHHDPATGRCKIYDHRPAGCRNYSCRKDPRMWRDFDARIPGPWLLQAAARDRTSRGGGPSGMSGTCSAQKENDNGQ